ncbi:hypothetical protein [Thiopseudomonas alkaliphila]|nr:hypothetical protein [Thiopseudomonas alkaliphila]
MPSHHKRLAMRTLLLITSGLSLAAILGLAWWGWSHSGMALLQLGLGVC